MYANISYTSLSELFLSIDAAKIGPNDFVAFIVAFTALVVAVISLLYAMKTLNVSRSTLASQQQTERNTQKVSFDKQRQLLLRLRLEVLKKMADLAVLLEYVNQKSNEELPDKTTKQINGQLYPKIHKFYDLMLSESFIYPDSVMVNQETSIKPSQFGSTDNYITLCKIKEKINLHNKLISNYYDLLASDITIDYERNNLLEDLLQRVLDIANDIYSVNCAYDDETIRAFENYIFAITRAPESKSIINNSLYMEQYKHIVLNFFRFDCRESTPNDYFKLFQLQAILTKNQISEWFYNKKFPGEKV